MGKVTPGIPYLISLYDEVPGCTISDRGATCVHFAIYRTDDSCGGHTSYEGTLSVEQMFALLRPGLTGRVSVPKSRFLGDTPGIKQILRIEGEVPNG